MKRLQFLLMILVAGLVSCSNDDDTSYPSLITEMAMAYANGQGLLSHFVTDSGRDCRVSNEIKGLDANETVRALISYVPENDSQAKVYSAQVIPVLPDATDKEPVAHDPLGVESVWLGGGFINLHLLPKSQGQKQQWAFLRDSTCTNVLGGQNHHLSLYHLQGKDPMAYSRDVYLCVAIDSVASTWTAADSITFVVHSFNGPKTWNFGKLAP